MGGNSPSHLAYEDDGEVGRVTFMKGVRVSERVKLSQYINF